MEISVTFPFEKDKPDVRGMASIRPYSTFNSATRRGREVHAIVAMGRDRSIGRDGDLPWHIPEDMKHFKELTMGHPVIMGRATWESLPKRPLPGRRNIVLTRNAEYVAEGAETAASLEEALALCPPPEVPFIIGGASVYAEALPLITHLHVTLVDTECPDADTFFPPVNAEGWSVQADEPQTSRNGQRFSFQTLTRKNR